jgi:predicted  nucleic acid-binding Zn-ribbon protein
MKTNPFKYALVVLACLSLCVVLSACGKGDSESSDLLNFSDDTTAAAQLVSEANEDLNKIKVKYKENEAKREDLKDAMKNNDVEKVKRISDDLVYIINDGMALGESAIGKIEKAQEMSINADFKEYLRLKELSLRKQMEAFENYRQAARSLRDGYNPKDEKQRETVRAAFTTRNENFQKIMDEAKEYSKQANNLAKESAKKGN